MLFNCTAEEIVPTMCLLMLRFSLTLVLGGINMFIKNCAKIRDKLPGNWRHLQNKRGGLRGGNVSDKRRDWASGLDSIHLLAGEAFKKRGFGMLKWLLSSSMVTGSRCCQEILIEGQILDNSIHHCFSQTASILRSWTLFLRRRKMRCDPIIVVSKKKGSQS